MTIKPQHQIAAAICVAAGVLGSCSSPTQQRKPSVTSKAAQLSVHAICEYRDFVRSTDYRGQPDAAPADVESPAWASMVRSEWTDDGRRVRWVLEFGADPIAGYNAAQIAETTGKIDFSVTATIWQGTGDDKTFVAVNIPIGSDTAFEAGSTSGAELPMASSTVTWNGPTMVVTIPRSSFTDALKSRYSFESDTQVLWPIEGVMGKQSHMSCLKEVEEFAADHPANTTSTAANSTTTTRAAQEPSTTTAILLTPSSIAALNSDCTEASIRSSEAYQVANTALSPDFDPAVKIAEVRCVDGWAAVFYNVPATSVGFFENRDGHWSGGKHADVNLPASDSDIFTGPSCHGVPPSIIAALLHVAAPNPC